MAPVVAVNDSVKGRRALRSAQARTDPVSGEDIVETLKLLRSNGEVLAFARWLRENPALCTTEALGIRSDLSTAAERGGHVRFKEAHFVGKGTTRRRIPEVPAEVAVPSDSGALFQEWARTDTQHAASLLLHTDEEAVDEITRLVAEQRRPSA
jgi:hypothetical protein